MNEKRSQAILAAADLLLLLAVVLEFAK